MSKVWQECSGDDVATVVWTGEAAGLAVADGEGAAGIQLNLDQLRSLARWLDETLAEQ